MPLAQPVVVTAADGRTFYAVKEAATRLGIADHQLRRLLASEKLPTAKVDEVSHSGRRGRPPTILIPFEAVERYRLELIDALGAREAGPDTADLEARIEELDRQNAGLRGRLASLEEVVRLGLVVEEARLDQIRQFIGPTTVQALADRSGPS